MVVEFSGKFSEKIPDDKFTVVLKKVKGESSVPLFSTLTFDIEFVKTHVKSETQHNGIDNKMDPCTGTTDNAEEENTEKSSYVSLYESVTEYLNGMYPVDMVEALNDGEEGKTTWGYICVALFMAGLMFVSMLATYIVLFSLRACCNKLSKKKESQASAVDQFRDENTNGFSVGQETSTTSYNQLDGKQKGPNAPVIW